MEKLLKLAKENDQAAYTEIVNHFKPIIQMISSSYFLIGGDGDDLIQEGNIGLYNAILSFDPEENNNFIKYAKICIHRAILSAIKRDSRLKNTALNTSLSLSEELEIRGQSAEEMFLERERLLEVYEKIEDKLTDMERRVLSLFMDGHSYKEIASALDKNVKAVDNALTRIRGKLS